MASDDLIRILMADDDEDDRLIFRDAVEVACLSNPIDFVVDGEELLDYLRRKGRYANGDAPPLPDLILLDLNMPKMDGREALAEIKADPAIRNIPVIVLTTSKAEEDVLRTYDMGASSFVTKPVTFESLVEVVRGLSNYWIGIVRLPAR